MLYPRLIARLDVKGEHLVKGVQLEGLRKVGKPADFARKYYEQGIDEILYIDIVASLYQRNHLLDLVKKTAAEVFVPISVGGGVRSIEDVNDLLRSGADKICINTAAVESPQLISDVANRFGSQCMVLSIEAKQISTGQWEVYTNCGRERTGRDVLTWAKEGVERGAGEILLTSIDQEGSTKGFDCALTRLVAEAVSVPVIACGGMGKPAHMADVLINGRADAVAVAHVLHYNEMTVADLRDAMLAEVVA